MVLGTGIDIIEIERIERAVNRWGDSFLEHIFNEEEIQYAKKRKYPMQHYAARFAAKEAIYKALGDDNRRVGWKNLTILNDEHGKPYCILNGVNLKHNIFISLSHTENYAVANAVVTKADG